MKAEYDQFIGTYDESVPIELCEEFVTNYDVAKENRTIINLNEDNEGWAKEPPPTLDRKDEPIFVHPIMSSIYPRPPVMAYYSHLRGCFHEYIDRYQIRFESPIYNDAFKIHKVKQCEGYHVWHYEKGNYIDNERVITYLTYLEVPTKGGETEFLHQSLRVEPIVGRTLLWPAGFTHVHRGNPPLEGEKMYITGWFTAGKEAFNWI
jgi:hypothetical protein